MSEMDAREHAVDERPPDAVPPSGDIGVEAPEADAVEQYRAVRDGTGPWPLQEIPIEVDPADAHDQNWQVDLDEDDYR